MIVKQETSKGVTFKGSKELAESLPAGMIRKLEATFGIPYAQIYNVINGMNHTSNLALLECAMRVSKLHASIKYDEKIAELLKEYETVKN